jgi:hypothetical protein
MSGSYSCGTDAAKASIWSQSSGGKVGRLYLGFAYACAADIPTRRRRIKRVNVEEDEFRPAHSVCRISTIFQAPLVSSGTNCFARWRGHGDHDHDSGQKSHDRLFLFICLALSGQVFCIECPLDHSDGLVWILLQDLWK